MIEVSFCIPVYNAEKYIKRCLDSICATKGINYEIICYDDKSSDNSIEVINNYALEHNIGIKIYQGSENHGVSYARNFLLEKANGKYIKFIDSDDMIVADCIKLFYDAAEKNNVNLVLASMIGVAEDSNQPFGTAINEYKIIKNQGQVLDLNFPKAVNSTCTCFYNLNFLKENNLKFDDRVAFGEDMLFNYNVLLKITELIDFNCICYNYRNNPHSLTNTPTDCEKKRKILAQENLFKVLNEYLEEGRFNPSDMCNNEETLKLKIQNSKQNIALVLASIRDKKYIKQKLKELKQQNIFPYKRDKSVLKGKGNFMKKWLTYMLPVKPFFWIMHLVYKMSGK